MNRRRPFECAWAARFPAAEGCGGRAMGGQEIRGMMGAWITLETNRFGEVFDYK